jgi:hypothetical protein
MNKTFYTITIAALLFAGCDPVRDEVENSSSITNASQIEATVTTIQRDGYDNTVHVRCTSPVLCSWTDGVRTFVGTEGDLEVMFEGNRTITLTARAADGKTYTKEYTVNITNAPAPPAYYELLFGDPNGTGKVWEWNTTWTAPERETPGEKRIMAGINPGDKRDYWGWTPEPEGDEGIGATMKFMLFGQKIIKYKADGTVISEGTLSIDMTPNKIYESKGTLTFVGTNVLSPISPNEGQGEFGTTYTITFLDDEHLMLYTADASSGWYYVFTAKQ